MGAIVNFLRSKGKIGAVGVMLVGLGHVVGVFLGKLEGTYQDGMAVFFMGLSLLGIRGAISKPSA